MRMIAAYTRITSRLRTTFQPAEIVNVLAAAWIQFQVHDWFAHKKGTRTHTHDIPLADGGRHEIRTVSVRDR